MSGAALQEIECRECEVVLPLHRGRLYEKYLTHTHRVDRYAGVRKSRLREKPPKRHHK